MDAESDREKWGCKSPPPFLHRFPYSTASSLLHYLKLIPGTLIVLGKSGPLINAQENGGYAILNLSYWKSFDHLVEFTNAEGHTRARNWWNKTVKQHAHIGIMHETYSVPSGQWENIYENFSPIAMGEFLIFLPIHAPIPIRFRTCSGERAGKMEDADSFTPTQEKPNIYSPPRSPTRRSRTND